MVHTYKLFLDIEYWIGLKDYKRICGNYICQELTHNNLK